MSGLSDSVNFGSSLRNSQDAAATAWAGIRPDTACTTPRNPSPRDTNETRRPQDVLALAADVAESTGNSVPLNEVRLQNALLVMQSLAGALQNNAQAAPQTHPTFAAHFRGCNYADLEELAAAAKRIQGDILTARAYRPPPSAATSVESRCAWNGGAVAARARRANASARFADEQVPRGWQLSDQRPTTPLCVTLHARSARPTRDQVCGTPRSGEAMTHQFAASNARAGVVSAAVVTNVVQQVTKPASAVAHPVRNRRPVTETDEAAGNYAGYRAAIESTTDARSTIKRCS
ncbi:hypothetical protein HPB50_004336 [Hyalomma asiaticum]|uniref:Uncharacterized protein n=1 Tax=Hyalomma asiaticum TaxID=266040 RepID=A0ACB7SKS6_HYAAI|nr:hypothetical protein HPB50_004336 [Hyalomma asiaticum]